MQHPNSIVVLDFGGQYAHLIASRVRRFGVYAEIKEPETPASELANAAGIILSGGPQSVYDADSPQADPAIFELGIPVLGLCYGLQWMTQILGGEVQSGKVKEYGRTPIRTVDGGGTLLQDCGEGCTVWMSHGDEAVILPDGFSLIATSDACTNAAFADHDRQFFALQFHPEVTHSEHGFDMLKRFTALCDAAPWSIEGYRDRIAAEITETAGDRNVFMLVSGGVDSMVAFSLLNDVLGSDRVCGLLVDTGLMRKNEVAGVRSAVDALGWKNLDVVDASDEFFAALENVYEPEEKRSIIGNTFLTVQQQVCADMGLTDGWLLGQGTIYPDTIETGATKHADKIKTHHNRVEAIERMIEQGLVIEPLKDLYKDEVRELGADLGLPTDLVWRHPFPGPGLGVRILCLAPDDAEALQEDAAIDAALPSVDHTVLPIQSVGVQGDGRTYRRPLALFGESSCHIPDAYWDYSVSIPNQSAQINRVLFCTSHTEQQSFLSAPQHVTRARADLLRAADAIAHEEMMDAGLQHDIWQFPVVLLPVGVAAGNQSIVLRPIASTDAMTASAFHLPQEVLQRMTERILALDGIDTVFFDMTNKPPGTIEWE